MPGRRQAPPLGDRLGPRPGTLSLRSSALSSLQRLQLGRAMASTLEEFLLASFPLPSSTLAPQPPSVSAVAYPLQPKQDGRLCVATPHSGIALYDVSHSSARSTTILPPTPLGYSSSKSCRSQAAARRERCFCSSAPQRPFQAGEEGSGVGYRDRQANNLYHPTTARRPDSIVVHHPGPFLPTYHLRRLALHPFFSSRLDSRKRCAQHLGRSQGG